MLRLHIGFRRIRNILLYTSSDPACAGPPSPQGEGLDGTQTKQLDKLEFTTRRSPMGSGGTGCIAVHLPVDFVPMLAGSAHLR